MDGRWVALQRGPQGRWEVPVVIFFKGRVRGDKRKGWGKSEQKGDSKDENKRAEHPWPWSLGLKGDLESQVRLTLVDTKWKYSSVGCLPRIISSCSTLSSHNLSRQTHLTKQTTLRDPSRTYSPLASCILLNSKWNMNAWSLRWQTATLKKEGLQSPWANSLILNNRLAVNLCWFPTDSQCRCT